MVADHGRITKELHEWSKGDDRALGRLTPLIYAELRKIARCQMSREAANHTLQPTALISEAFIKLSAVKDIDWTDRHHFYRVASRIMRRVLTDHARKRSSAKRWGKVRQVPYEDALTQPAPTSHPIDLIILNEALEELEKADPRKVQVVELSFYGGLTIDEIADVLQISSTTVGRDLDFAKAWIARALKRG